MGPYFKGIAGAAAAAAALVTTSSAWAQDGETRSGRTITIGPGVAYVPEFPGAKKQAIDFWPIIAVRPLGEEAQYEAPDDNFGFGIIGNRNFVIGPALNVQRGRDEDDAIPGIGDVKTTFEAGAFAEGYLADHVRFRASVRKGFGGHKGLVADGGVDFIMGKASDTFHFSLGPRVRYANARYQRAFYGVNAEQAAATGLPLYRPGGGLQSAGALAFANYQMSRAIGVQTYARYDRLLGDAKDSPLVLSDVGSRNQYEVGIGLTYTFDLIL